MNSSWKAAIREAWALAKAKQVYLDTLEITHPDVASKYLVKDRKNWDLTLEGAGGVKTFQACAIRITLPASGENGLQDLNLALDNTDRQITRYIETVKGSKDKVRVVYRCYMPEDTSQPQNDPPMIVTLTDVKVNNREVTGRCSFADIINMPFGTENYIRSRFKSLSQ